MSNLLSEIETGKLKDQRIIEHLAQLLKNESDIKSQLKGLNNLEIFSFYLRKNQFKFKQYLQDSVLKTKLSQPGSYQPYVEQIQHLQKQLKGIDRGIVYNTADVLQEHYQLNMASISFGQKNAVILNKVIKKLAIQNQTSEINFWGKILGFQDYYIIKGVSTKKYSQHLPAEGEKYGVGINSYSYWVSNNILSHWQELPLITPAQMAASRNFQYIFTGDLNKEIQGKNFQGKEKHLLKCIVARITHSCQIVPKGIYKTNEDNPDIIEFEQDAKMPELSELNSTENWCHYNAGILSQGRVTHYVDQKLAQEERETLAAELAEKQPLVERFKSISQDQPCQRLGHTSNWTAQICGETVPVSQIGAKEGNTEIYGVILLKNQVWEGAYTIAHKKGWINIYIGYGHRLSFQQKDIITLPDLQLQPKETDQFPEPNPATLPPPPQQQKKQEQQPDGKQQQGQQDKQPDQQ